MRLPSYCSKTNYHSHNQPIHTTNHARIHTRNKTAQVWEIGDFVVQVPWDCFPVPDCVNGGNQTYLYAHHGGLVKVLPRMMPNEDSWIKESVRACVCVPVWGVRDGGMCTRTSALFCFTEFY